MSRKRSLAAEVLATPLAGYSLRLHFALGLTAGFLFVSSHLVLVVKALAADATRKGKLTGVDECVNSGEKSKVGVSISRSIVHTYFSL